MSKKRKLNSKNPKYMDKSLVTEKKVIRRELINNIKGVKINANESGSALYIRDSLNVYFRAE